MTEDEARTWIKDSFDVSHETWARLERFVDLLLEESERQNLIAASTVPEVWARHIVDSAQLLTMVPTGFPPGEWIDLGSGPGLPGLVVAILSDRPMRLVESRRGRYEFLENIVQRLGLSHVSVAGVTLERLVPEAPAAIISARAFAPLPRLLEKAARFADTGTLWLLPKGRNAESELDIARRSWQGAFHMKHSITSDESIIITATGVQPRGRKQRAARR